jgi:hypothetical protein
VPQQEGFACLVSTIDEVTGALHQVSLDRRHPLPRERTGVGNGLLADPAEAFIFGRVVHV